MRTRRVLVAYGSKHGGTAGIAGLLGRALQREGFDAEIWPAREVRCVDCYDAVVLGGSIYSSRWHPDAADFARRFGPELTGRPVWLFSSGPLDNSADHDDIPPVPKAARAMELMGAIGHATFGGRLTAESATWLGRKMIDSGHGGDFRNPAHIAAWAREITGRLQRVRAVPA